METNPAPFPGKRHPAAAKDGDQPQPSARPAPPPARPKRTFGTARSSNVSVAKPLQKPLPTKPSKPSIRPSRNGTKKSSNAAETEKKSMQGEREEERTPLSMPSSLTEPAVETPYQSAENCSKCRCDKLETAAYWLAHIKLAESASKHFVAAAFFRIASDCRAQPFCSLQRELKRYVARHSSIASELQWNDLCVVYGLSNDQPIVGPCDLGKLDVLVQQGDSKLKDECFEFDIIDHPLIDIEKETTALVATNVTVTSDDAFTEEFVHVKPQSSNNSSLNDGRKVLNQHQLARRTVAGAKVSRNSQILNRGKDGKKAADASLSELN